MNLLNSDLNNHFKEKKAVKVIAGIQNTKISQIAKIAQAAELANASYLDIAANTKVVKFLKSFSSLPICVSSIEPIDAYNCVVAGANIVEVGNYDYFYSKGIYVSDKYIIKLVKEIKSLIYNTPICVTIPYYLSLDEQLNLAKTLDFLGVNILQTEGLYYSYPFKNMVKSNHRRTQLYCSEVLSSSLLSTNVISENVNLPIVTSSGVNDVFTSCTKLYGASGVGIGSAINKKKSLTDMVKYINQVKSSLINNQKTTTKLLVNRNKKY